VVDMTNDPAERLIETMVPSRVTVGDVCCASAEDDHGPAASPIRHARTRTTCASLIHNPS